MPTWTPAIQWINDLGIDCSYRQLDYWCRLGYLGAEHMKAVGSGGRRSFNSTDLEVLFALARLARLTERPTPQIDRHTIAAAVRVRPVNRDGEVLVLAEDSTVLRFDHWCARRGELASAVYVIPLRSFAAATPGTAGDVSPDPATGENGRHRSAAVPARNRASSVFRSMGELIAGIEAARVFGMRDITVTTVHHRSTTSGPGDYIPERVEFHLDAAMLDLGSEEQRQLDHVAETRRHLTSAGGA